MKRLLAILSVVTVCAVSGLATTTASATEFHGITVTCTEPGANEATYTVSYGTHSLTFTLKYPGAKCLVH